jgi:UDPglucose--hexose-1-phosphate uridylyltransferase
MLEDTFHWHVEITPRLSTPAGFELGTSIYINTVPPEDAARYLREVKIEKSKKVEPAICEKEIV